MYPISQRNERFVMNIEFDAYKQKLNDRPPRWTDWRIP